MSSSRSSAFWIFSAITLAYVGCEFVYNRALLDLASGAPTRSQMDTIEWVGRVMAGFGFAMVIWRLLRQADDPFFYWRGFFLCVAICVPLMWGVQEIIIKSIVETAGPQTLRSASLAMAGREAMKPSSEHVYVGRPTSGFSPLLLNDELVERNESASANKACASNLLWMEKPTFSRDSKTLWALLGSLALNDYVMLDALQKKAANFARCRAKAMPIITGRQYAFYKKNTEQLKSLYAQYTTASEEVAKYSKGIWASENRTKAIWQSNVNRYFGFDTSIKWGLSEREFNTHPDVMRLASERAGLEGANIALGLDLDGFRNNLAKGVDLSTADFREFHRGGRLHEPSKKAYKALLVPLIGLSLSLFFGLYNASLLILSIFRQVVGIKVPSLIAALLIALAPINMRSSPLADTKEHRAMIASAHRASPFYGRILEWTARAESSFGL